MYDLDDYGRDDSGPVAVACLVIAVIIAIAGICFIFNDTPTEEQEQKMTGSGYELVLDCSNAYQMHRYGLPTKADCMQYHVHGQWGYYMAGDLYAYDDLPGGSDAWDKLYGIEDNPAFDKE